MDISFIGSGNLAWHLAPALDNVGYIVREVYSPNPKHAEALTERLYQADVKTTLDFSNSKSRLFIIATRDDKIQEVARDIVLPDDATLVHTSGSQPLSLLQFAAAANTGVVYPLQTFSKGKRIDFKVVPIFIESSNEDSEKVLSSMAKAISGNVKSITSSERQALHLAAVFASNFPNHMLTIAKKVLQDNNLDFEVMKALILETMTKSLELGPDKAQTGPAIRSDLEVLDRHLEFLKDDERVAEIYRVMSQHIIDTYESN